ncbi:hypothetical protein [Cupriavidus necator]
MQSWNQSNFEYYMPINGEMPDIWTLEEVRQQRMSKIDQKRYVTHYNNGAFDKCAELMRNVLSHNKKREIQPFDLDALDRISQGSTNFHGSRSASLLAFSPSIPLNLRGRLNPTGDMLRSGWAPHSGELGNALEPNSLNNRYVSVVDRMNLLTSYSYATTLHSQPWSAENTQSKLESNIDGDPTFVNNKRQLYKLQLNQWNAFPEGGVERDLINQNFSVLYGIRLGESEVLEKGGMPGEIGVRDGISSDKIRMIFVPDEHVQQVRDYLQGQGYPMIPVNSLAALEREPSFGLTTSAPSVQPPTPLPSQQQQQVVNQPPEMPHTAVQPKLPQLPAVTASAAYQTLGSGHEQAPLQAPVSTGSALTNPMSSGQPISHTVVALPHQPTQQLPQTETTPLSGIGQQQVPPQHEASGSPATLSAQLPPSGGASMPSLPTYRMPDHQPTSQRDQRPRSYT